MTLVINDSLVGPPTWFASYREFTLIASCNGHDILIRSDSIDTYYSWLKPRGGLDFVKQFIRWNERQSGITFDVRNSFPGTVILKPFVPENIHQTLRVLDRFSIY